MINQRMYTLGSSPNPIRAQYAYGLARRKEVGEENVYDYSIGNPSVPAPVVVKERIQDLLEQPPEIIHGYTMSTGLQEARQAVADDLSKRFSIKANPNNVYLTTGATAALYITTAAITNPGDEVIVNAPYFPEYKIMIESARCKCVEVPVRSDNFQLDCQAIEKALTPKTSAIVINSPNNPVGCVYTEETIKNLASVLRKKEEEFGHPIYLISDEPYREIVYECKVPFTAHYYNDTIICYSWAKTLSLPGERIGYIYVNEGMNDAKDVFYAISGAGRALGFICAPALFQRVIQTCITHPADTTAYAKNRDLLTSILDECGYTYIQPDGAFYLWIKALEDDAVAFCDAARKYDLLLVSSDCFGCSGWVRASYCIDENTISRSKKAWQQLFDDYSNKQK